MSRCWRYRRSTADEPDKFARTLRIDGSAAALAGTATVQGSPSDSSERHVVTHPVVEAPPSGEPDPEFLELFIEEAREEVASVQQNFPAWDQNPHDADALSTLRRSFHTLKGSGRMVGAKLIGEFSWSIENLLNRIINKTLTRSPAIVAVLREAVAALPELVEQLEVGRGPNADVPGIMGRAEALAEGRESDGAATVAISEATTVDASSRPAAAPAERPAPPPQAAAEAVTPPPATPRQMDPQLHEIYSKEAAGHIAVIRDYLTPVRNSVAALRNTRIRLSRLPHAERQFQDGGSSPGHQDRRAAQSLHAQGVRRRSRPWRGRVESARGRGDRDRRRGRPHQRDHRIFPRSARTASIASTSSTGASTPSR